MSVWVWEVLEDDGSWGTIAAGIRGVSKAPVPLVARSLQVADMMGLAAVAHHDQTGKRVRKARYELAEVVGEVP